MTSERRCLQKELPATPEHLLLHEPPFLSEGKGR